MEHSFRFDVPKEFCLVCGSGYAVCTLVMSVMSANVIIVINSSENVVVEVD